MRQTLRASALLVLLFAFAGSASAQTRTNTGGGSSLFGSGSSLFGGGGAGGAGGGIGGANADFGIGSDQPFTLQQDGDSGGFVGRDNADTGAVFEGLNPGGNEFLNQVQRAFNSRNRGRGTNQAVDARPPIRVRLKLGFRPTIASENLLAPSAQRVNSLLDEKGFAGASATPADAGVVVLRGVVADDSERRMLERLARLEPGIRRVENQLTVTQDDEVLPPPGG